MVMVQVLPVQVVAGKVTDAVERKEFVENVVNNPPADSNTTDSEILYEVKEKRDEHTKVFKKNDGSYTAIKTEEPLHYLNNGIWEEIDNSLFLDGEIYTNSENLFNVEFPESIDVNESVIVENDGYELSFNFNDITESLAVVENDVLVGDTEISVADDAISQTQSSVMYNDIADDTDLQYIVTPDTIKENIIVSNKESVKDTYTFTFETNGLDAEKLEDGSVVFKDELNETKFKIPRPVMQDSHFAFSYDIGVELIKNNDDTITLEYSPSNDWTSSSERVYPITIDPAITINCGGESFIENTGVGFNSSQPELADRHYADTYLALLVNTPEFENGDGTTSIYHTELYTIIDTDIFSDLGNNVVFTEVQYLFNGLMVTEGKALAREISEDWDIDTVTYNTKPELSNEIIDFYKSPISEGEELNDIVYVHFNITKIFNDWFNGKENNGFAITADENFIGFIALNGGPKSTVLVLDYVDFPGGYDKNLSHHTQMAGKAGNGYVNDLTQQLYVVRDDFSFNSNLGTLGMVYNSAAYTKLEIMNYNTILAYGKNWLPNIYRACLPDEDDNVTYYTDTGSTIYFTRSTDKSGNVIFEEPHSDMNFDHGYELEYIPESDGNDESYIIKRPDGNVEYFNEDGLLISVKNADNPTKSINITYDSMGRIYYISDFDGNNYLFVYSYYENSGTELLLGIQYSMRNSTPDYVRYDYDSQGNLVSADYSDGKQVEYKYSNGKISKITNIGSSEILYEYENGKIKKVTEKAYDGENYVDSRITTYDRLSPTQIKVTDKNNNYEIYQYNNNGDFLYKIDSELVEKSNTETEVNLIKNGKFAENSAFWDSTENLNISDQTINGENVKAVELPALSETQNVIYQTVESAGGFKKNDTIEFSGWFKGSFIKSTTNNSWLCDLIENSEAPKICNFTNDRYAQIEVSYQYNEIDENGVEIPHSETIVSSFSENVDDWQYTSEAFMLKGDCEELFIGVRYSNNANSGLISNIELIKNGGYTIDCDVTNNRIDSLHFGNREVLSYSYDGDDNITEIVYNDDTYKKNVTKMEDDDGELVSITENNKIKYRFSRNSDGSVSILSADNRIIRYADDITGLSSFTNSQYHSIKNNGNEFVESLNGESYITTVQNPEFNISSGNSIENSAVTAETAGNSIAVTSQQDLYGRREKCIVEAGNVKNTDSEKTFAVIENEFDYISDTDFADLNKVSIYKNTINSKTRNNSCNYSFFYEYNVNGDIIKEYDYISENSMELRYSYGYDSENRLIRFDDNLSDSKRSFSFEYDDEGNLISKSTYSYTPLETELSEPLSTEYYTYGESNAVVESDGNICYNEDGRLISFNGGELTWNGNQLSKYEITQTDENNSNNNLKKRIRYSYSDDGFLSGKTIEVKPENSSDEMYQETERYNYTWSYGKLISQTCTKTESGQQTTYTVKYVYDSFNSVQGFIFNHSETYLYLKNIQGDIIGVVNEAGEVVLSYEYSESFVPSTKSKATDGNYDFIELLPIKYRGCFYDYDTNLYYVNGEFVNADLPNNPALRDAAYNYSLYSYWENQPLGYKSSDECEVYFANSIANYLYNKDLPDQPNVNIFDSDGYLREQSESDVGKYRYGYTLTMYQGCGWIATYNAAKILGLDIPPCEIIREYELNGVLAYGYLGSQPLAIAQFFMRRGYDVNIKLKSAEDEPTEAFDNLAGMYKANILLFTRDNGITKHYITLDKVDDDYYLAYNRDVYDAENDYIDDSLENFLKHKQSILISISKINASV